MSSFAPISLDRAAEVPLGTQLAWVLRSRIASGQLRRGERLPGARELAGQVGVNVNTVRSVFARLEEDGLLEVIHGKGTFVTDGPRPASAVAELAAAVTSEARRRGIDPRAVAAALYVEPPAAAGDANARRLLREQIGALEGQLAELPPLPPAGDSAAVPPPRPSAAGRLLTTAELERLRDELTAQVADARHRQDAQPGTADDAAQPAPAVSTPPTARRVRGRAPIHDPATHAGGRRRGSATLRWVPGG